MPLSDGEYRLLLITSYFRKRLFVFCVFMNEMFTFAVGCLFHDKISMEMFSNWTSALNLSQDEMDFLSKIK